MGRPAFIRFLTAQPERPGRVHWGAETATWDELLALGRRRSVLVAPQRAYAVDPTAGLESLVSLLAVATVPDTVLIWAAAGLDDGVPLAPGLREIASPVPVPLERPLWGVGTSGSSGAPKFAIGYADAWELIVLHYERAVFRTAFAGRLPATLATCLPLQFSAAFFMTVLPSLFLRRDLLVFDNHDWSAVQRLAATGDVFVLGVPALAAAACLGTPDPVDMRGAALFLGGGHLSAQRVELIRERFSGATVANLYGSAETGAVAVDYAPGHNRHVGRPIEGKAAWLRDTDEQGVGAVALSGVDCCAYVWRPGGDAVPNAGYVTGTDLARFDADGNLCLQGRLDGAEKLSGVLVYPREIERHLLALPGVTDARVRVETTATGLERLCAKVVGTVDEAAVRAHCAGLGPAERPARIECVAERNAVAAYSSNGKL